MANIEEFDDDNFAPPAKDAKPAVKGARPGKPTETAVTPPAPEPDEKPAKGAQTPAAIAQVAPPVDAKEYEVTRDTRCLWRGVTIKLRAGTIISDANYGPNAYERFVNQGVPMIEKANKA